MNLNVAHMIFICSSQHSHNWLIMGKHMLKFFLNHKNILTFSPSTYMNATIPMQKFTIYNIYNGRSSLGGGGMGTYIILKTLGENVLC